MKKFQICALFLLAICLIVSTAACGGNKTSPASAPQEESMPAPAARDFSSENGETAREERETPTQTDPDGQDGNDGNEDSPDETQRMRKPPKPRKIPAAEIPRRLPIRPEPMPTPVPKPIF